MKCPRDCRNYYASVCIKHNRHSHEDASPVTTLSEVISVIPDFSSPSTSNDYGSYDSSSSSSSDDGFSGGGGDYGGGGASGDW